MPFQYIGVGKADGSDVKEEATRPVESEFLGMRDKCIFKVLG